MVGNLTEQSEQTATAASASGTDVTFRTEVRARDVDAPTTEDAVAVSIRNISLWYGKKQALGDVTLDIPKNRVTALIGPSGCGKSTLLRCINRMNDLIPDVRISGEVLIDGENIYGHDTDPVEVRRVVGMVFQKPNPFPKSIYENVAFGARVNGLSRQHGRARRALVAACRALGRGQGRPQEVGARALRRSASSGSASLARSRRTPRSCSWTSLVQPSTRSRPSASRT